MCESADQLVTNRFTTDRRFVPAETLVELPLLEPLADVVNGDVLCPLHSRNACRIELGYDVFVGEFHEDTLDERDDGELTSVVGDHQLEICPWFVTRLLRLLAVKS